MVTFVSVISLCSSCSTESILRYTASPTCRASDSFTALRAMEYVGVMVLVDRLRCLLCQNVVISTIHFRLAIESSDMVEAEIPHTSIRIFPFGL